MYFYFHLSSWCIIIINAEKVKVKIIFSNLNAKMSHGKYNLNWHTYSEHLRNMLHEMMKSEELTDVTLVCDDKRQFKAHKIVLSACSRCNYTTQCGSLQTHSQIKHEGVKYPCNHYGYQANRKHLLLRHLKTQHELSKDKLSK